VQLDVHVKLHEDGRATVTERLAFSRGILEQDAGSPGGWNLEKSLGREAALERAACFGEGARLTSHRSSSTTDGGIEAVSVYDLAHVHSFRFLPPFPAMKGHTNGLLRLTVEPCYSTRWASPDQPGWMALQIGTINVPKHGRPKGNVTRGASPKELQSVRDLHPLLKELIRGFHLKVTVEAYDVLIGGINAAGPQKGLAVYHTARGTRVPTRVKTLLDISDQNLDRNGRNILENEEIMLDVLRGDFGGPGIRAELDRFRKYGPQLFHYNPRLPFLYEDGMDWQTCRVCFRPSPYHFKQYFDGKPESQGGNVKGK
jgi:hypothetical protein